MWFYVQASGRLWHNGAFVGAGYSGHGEGRNNPELQDIPNIGPIPCGHYLIDAPHDHPRLGPYVLGLEPDDQNEMFTRADFYVHGDSVAHPGELNASHGCIIAARVVREQIGQSVDKALTVVSEEGQLLDV